MNRERIARQLLTLARELVSEESGKVSNKKELQEMAEEIAREAFGDDFDQKKIDDVVDEAIADATDADGNVDWEKASGIVVGSFNS